MRDLHLLPKAHLHTHLESTVRPATIRDLGGEPPVRGRPFGSFGEFADQRAMMGALLRDHGHFRRIAEEFCHDEASQGVRYAEVTFTAAAHGERLGDPEMPPEAVLEDPDLVAELRSRRMPLEVCPSSNVLLGLVPTLAEHPLPRMVEAGLMVTLNTDGETSLAAEYRRAQEIFGYGDAALADLARASVEGSFAPAELKAQVSDEIDQWLSR